MKYEVHISTKFYNIYETDESVMGYGHSLTKIQYFINIYIIKCDRGAILQIPVKSLYVYYPYSSLENEVLEIESTEIRDYRRNSFTATYIISHYDGTWYYL